MGLSNVSPIVAHRSVFLTWDELNAGLESCLHNDNGVLNSAHRVNGVVNSAHVICDVVALLATTECKLQELVNDV